METEQAVPGGNKVSGTCYELRERKAAATSLGFYTFQEVALGPTMAGTELPPRLSPLLLRTGTL